MTSKEQNRYAGMVGKSVPARHASLATRHGISAEIS